MNRRSDILANVVVYYYRRIKVEHKCMKMEKIVHILAVFAGDYDIF